MCSVVSSQATDTNLLLNSHQIQLKDAADLRHNAPNPPNECT